MACSGRRKSKATSERRPCLCHPGCTKVLGSAQRTRHRRILREQEARSESSGASSQAEALALEVHDFTSSRDKGPEDRYMHEPQTAEGLASPIDVDQEGSDLEFPKQNLQNWYSDTPSESDDSDDSESPQSTESESSREDDIPLRPDDVTEEDLIRILQERYGDQWQEELHGLRESR